MDFSQSKVSTRGPLIAVIKIQLSSQKADRIFLHQNDNDYNLAQQFQQKHSLKPQLINIIYQKIQLSRNTLQKKFDHIKSISSDPIQQIIESSKKTKQKNQISKYQDNFIRSYNQSPQCCQFNQLFNQNILINNTKKNSNINNTNKLEKQVINKNQNVINKILKTSLIEQNKKQQQTLYHNKFTKDRQKQLKQQKLNKQQQTLYRDKSLKNKKFTQYSFDDDKPSRVKIIRKQQLSQLQSSLRRSISKTQISKITKDVTNRLYNQSQIKKNYLEKIKQRVKIERQDKQKQQLTHRPLINPISNVIAQDRLKNKKLQQHLIQEGKRIQLKRQHSKSILDKKQLHGCSFHPQVNPISKKLVAGRSQSQLSQPKQQKCKFIDENCRFRPQINKASENIIKTKGNFDQRLKLFLQAKNLRLSQKARQKRNQQIIDPNSGQQLFKPKISVNKSQVPRGSNIGEYLFNLSKSGKCQHPQEFSLKINQNSQQIVKQMYLKRLAWIFSQLDNDQDGFISQNKICINTIEADVLEILMPVLFEMQQMEIELSFSDFRNAINNLHNSLTALQKSILYNYKKKKQ